MRENRKWGGRCRVDVRSRRLTQKLGGWGLWVPSFLLQGLRGWESNGWPPRIQKNNLEVATQPTPRKTSFSLVDFPVNHFAANLLFFPFSLLCFQIFEMTYIHVNNPTQQPNTSRATNQSQPHLSPKTWQPNPPSPLSPHSIRPYSFHTYTILNAPHFTTTKIVKMLYQTEYTHNLNLF